MSFHLAEFDVASLGQLLQAHSFNPVHARPILRDFYAAAGATEFSASLGWRLQQFLLSSAQPIASRVLTSSTSADGTTKLLLQLADGHTVETVFMPAYRGDDAMGCVSSQVGCAMGCDFCASTRGGLVRNLTVVEIVEQFLHLRKLAIERGRRMKTIVFMGMGEPMHNLDAVLPAVRCIADPDMGGIGWRQVTISTVGIVPGIHRLIEADLNVHLAVSLHAPDDETRSKLVPMNRRYPVADVIAATREFLAKTGRVPTIEYCLLAGVNDSPRQAVMLADLVRGVKIHVNLIPYNPIGSGLSGVSYSKPSGDSVANFLHHLRVAGAIAHVRDTRGDDVDAACGQLRERVTSPA